MTDFLKLYTSKGLRSLMGKNLPLWVGLYLLLLVATTAALFAIATAELSSTTGGANGPFGELLKMGKPAAKVFIAHNIYLLAVLSICVFKNETDR